jgi:hypothetical protein
MANTLTNLIPDLYEALDVVSREPVGFIPSVTLLPSAERAALNQTIRVPITEAQQAEDVSPGQLPPDTGDQTIDNRTITISRSKVVPFRWTGEEEKGLNTGPGFPNIRVNQISQAFRTLSNLIEVDIGSLHTQASRAYGTAGTPPFASDLSDTAQVRKILTDNGSPLTDLQLVIDTTAGAKVRSLAQLTKANEAGTTELREVGKLLDIHGFTLRESAGVATSSIGTITGTVTGSAAKGAVSITLTTSSASGVALIAGDIVTFGDGYKYLVVSNCTIGASTTGTLTIANPGLRATISSATPVVSAASVRNFAFNRGAIVLASRMPALPEGGDMAIDSAEITDPISGITYEIRMYALYRRIRYEIGLAWGYSLIKPEHSAILLG